jgi:hypothetical protein
MWPFSKKQKQDHDALEKQRTEIKETASRIEKLVDEIHEATVMRKNVSG